MLIVQETIQVTKTTSATNNRQPMRELAQNAYMLQAIIGTQ